MLVLSRKSNESIVFPELGIEIEVVRVKGSTVRLGIKAPQEIKVLRKELINDDTDQVNEHDRDQPSLHSVRTSEVGEDTVDSHIGEPYRLLDRQRTG